MFRERGSKVVRRSEQGALRAGPAAPPTTAVAAAASDPGAGALRRLVEERLAKLLPGPAEAPARLHEAMHYSLMAPGKRLRPLLCLLTARAGGGSDEAALDAGCAIEMVHTASLILDDLPSMDDASLRRGRATAHLQFGESTAILASIALLNRAYGVISAQPALAPGLRAELLERLADSVGSRGLAGGQERDLNGWSELTDLDSVDDLNALKTGVLFVLSAEFGGRICGLDGEALAALRRFAGHLGLAFQTLDDLVDVTASAEAAAKDVGQDAGKPTAIALAGCDAADARIRQHLGEARAALGLCGFESATLERFVGSVFNGYWRP